jgi:hypothetical protein
MLTGKDQNGQDNGCYDEQDKPVAAGGLGVGKPPHDRFEEIDAHFAQIGEGVVILIGTTLFRHIVAQGAKQVSAQLRGRRVSG